MSDRRGQILEAAARVMGERGYRATSVGDVIEAAGLAGKSHFYHYFGSKQELGYAVVEHQFARFADRGLAILREPMIDPLDRLHLFIDSLVALQVADGARSGSPFGRLAAELASGDEGFRERLAAVFARWADAVRQLLDELAGALVPDADTRRMSRFVVATLEGGLMLARVSRDVGMLAGIATDLKRYVALHVRTEEAGRVALVGGARG